MIEERAVVLYELYNQILKANNMPFNLNFILREEDHHLKMVIQIIQKKDPDFKDRAVCLFKYEGDAFTSLVNEWLTVLQ
jgi:rubrerythrin